VSTAKAQPNNGILHFWAHFEHLFASGKIDHHSWLGALSDRVWAFLNLAQVVSGKEEKTS
jgi:hypothetical protein